MFLLPKVDIIVLNCNGIKIMPACITTLLKNTLYPFHLIVVDNCSTDGSREWLVKHVKNLKNATLHLNEELDGGFSAGNNIGLQYAKGDYVLLLNNDTLIFERGWLHGLVEEMEADKKIGIEGAKLLYPNDLIQHAGVTYVIDPYQNMALPFHIGRFEKREKYAEKRALPAVTFACAFIRRELLKDGLDESYGKGNYEDTEFCCQIRRDGWKILYNGEVELYHYEGATMLTQMKADREGWSQHTYDNWRKFSDKWNSWLLADMKENPSLYQAGIESLNSKWFGFNPKGIY